MISSWLVFWNTHTQFTSMRGTRTLHYRQSRNKSPRSFPGPMLDYGSGEALHADIIAAAAGELLLCDGHRACALGSKDCLPPTRRFECSHHTRLLGCRSIFFRQARILASLHHDVPDLAIEFATSPSFQSTFRRTFQPTALPDSPLTKQPFTVRSATAARACYPDPHPDIACFSNLSSSRAFA
jgi:hypothetical protein